LIWKYGDETGNFFGTVMVKPMLMVADGLMEYGDGCLWMLIWYFSSNFSRKKSGISR
jgi:hypothetical protein